MSTAIRMAGLVWVSLTVVSCALQRDARPEGGGDAATETELEESVGDAEPAESESAGEAPEGGSKPADAPLLSAPAPEKGEDWVRLISGAHLEGEIISFDDDTLVFEDEDLDEISIDWEDVAELYSPRQNSLMYGTRQTLAGTIHVTGDEVIVMTAEGERRLPRSELVNIVPGEPKEWNFWSTKLTLGLDLRRGNAKTTNFSLVGNIKRRTALTRFLIDFNSTFSEADGVTTADNNRVFSKFDYFVTGDLFLTPAFLEYFRDRFQNIDLRLVPGAGLGYEILGGGKVDWDVTLGGAYRYEEFRSAPAGESGTRDSGAAVVGTHFEWDIWKDIDWIIDYALQIGVPKTRDTNHHFKTTLSFELTSIFDFDVTFIWDRVGDPRPDDTGAKPRKDDFQVIFGLGIDIK